MKIAVLGAEGLLGRELIKYHSDFLPFTHRDCDITSIDSIVTMLRLRPDAVVNCAGIVRSKIWRYQTTDIVRVNSLAPHLIARECADLGIPFIQISTDCVFDGKSNDYYCEDCQPTPEDFYAQTKLVGEVTGTTIRTSFIGPSGGLLDWAHCAKPPIIGYDEEIWNGLSTKTVARCIWHYIHNKSYHPIIHLAGQSYSKYEMLDIANRVFGWGLDIQCGPTPENRKRSRLLTSKYQDNIGTALDIQLEMMK